MTPNSITGKVVDIIKGEIYPAKVLFGEGRILSIELLPESGKNEYSHENLPYIMPGFIDSHVHVESSMLVPSEFARAACAHGAVACVSDPHEIANVMGMEGIRYMIENSKQTPFRFYFGAPSCVPATGFELSGAEISSRQIEELFVSDDLYYMSEMMNYPGVIYDVPEVTEKLEIAKAYGRPIDGHAPGLRGKDLEKYVSAGINTDHEAFTLEEALEKISLGMKILIREGSAAKNFNALHPLIESHPDMCMFCSDDKNPADLIKGHINELVKESLAKGYSLMSVLKCASLNAKLHYNLQEGMLQVGDSADFIVAEDLNNLKINEVYIRGELVAKHGKTLIPETEVRIVNNFKAEKISASDLAVKAAGVQIRVINCIDGELITKSSIENAKIKDGLVISDTERDILKLIVLNRYVKQKPSVAFIKNFKLKEGALASSVAHDSHNIIAVGADDESIAKAVNAIVENKGGLAVAGQKGITEMPLPVAGLMSAAPAALAADLYDKLNKASKELGSNLHSPFMTLSFMALLVIPELKLSDKGLFNGDKFEFVDIFA